MRRPSSIFSVLAWILMIVGAIFLLFGLAAAALSLPMRNGDPWMFLPVGGVLLLAGGICALIAGQIRRTAARLRRLGVPVTGRVQAVKHHLFISVKQSALTVVNLPGQNSPWSVLCAYTWEGREYTVRSGLLWGQPSEGQHPTVYLDPHRPVRAWVDPDTIRIAF